jgi:hypothetical protein
MQTVAVLTEISCFLLHRNVSKCTALFIIYFDETLHTSTLTDSLQITNGIISLSYSGYMISLYVVCNESNTFEYLILSQKWLKFRCNVLSEELGSAGTRTVRKEDGTSTRGVLLAWDGTAQDVNRAFRVPYRGHQRIQCNWRGLPWTGQVWSNGDSSTANSAMLSICT